MRLLLRLIAILLALAPLWPTAAGWQATALALPAVSADEPVTVAGVTLDEVAVAGRPVRYDREIPMAALDNVKAAFGSALVDLPRLSGLPPFATPVAVYLLASQSRFRAALSELGGVRVELVDQQAGAYAIQRGETMLLFFRASEVDSAPSEALLVLAHELAHLAVREASRSRPVPQWFNEGYAAWLSKRVLGERFPREAATQRAVDRAVVASALLSGRGLLPWSELVTRSEFNQAGMQGWTSLEYGQSTLFMDWLAGRYGVGNLARFCWRSVTAPRPVRRFRRPLALSPRRRPTSRLRWRACPASWARGCTRSRRALGSGRTSPSSSSAVHRASGVPPCCGSMARYEYAVRRRWTRLGSWCSGSAGR